MLPKCTLTPPPLRGGQATQRTAAAYTLDRLVRWEAGERTSLWADLPTPTNTDAAKLRRAEALCREGLDGKACAALTANGLQGADRDTLEPFTREHPCHRAAPVPSQHYLPTCQPTSC